MRAADVNAAAYLSAKVDAAIESASQDVDTLCKVGDLSRPGFAPWTGTITFDAPVENNDDAYRFWLNNHPLYSLTSAITDDGADDVTADALPWPEYGPPYRALDLDEGTGAIFTFSSGRGQRSLTVTGVWCGALVGELTSSAWTLSGGINASVIAATLNAPLGVGSIVRIGSERMLVTERSWLDSTQNGTLTSSLADQILTVSSGAAFHVGEELLIDAERVLIQDIGGNTLIVKRAVGGSVLAAHTGADIYWARSCTIERGALGTTAAGHTNEDQIYVYKVPALIERLTVAYALDQLQQEQSGYARVVTNGESVSEFSGRAIAALEKRVQAAYGRQMRVRSV